MELNNDYFTLERSLDGQNWVEVEEIVGAGNSNNILSYQTVDLNPIQGLSYYRLKQTDFDGTYSYSNISAVKTLNTKLLDIKVYPNPTTDKVLVSNVTVEADLKVLNSIGQNLTGKVTSKLNYTDDLLEIDLSGIPNGLYHISVGNKTSTILKQ